MSSNPSDGYVYQKQYRSLMQCDFCSRMKNSMYEVVLDEYLFHFCSVSEARLGMENYANNKAKGLTTKIEKTIESPLLEDE